MIPVPPEKWRIWVGDEVELLDGRDKGKRGRVIGCILEKNRVIVEGLNKVVRVVRPNAEQRGQLVAQESPIYLSNVQLVDPKTKKKTRITWKFLEDGTKVRVSKVSGVVIPDNRPKQQVELTPANYQAACITPIDIVRKVTYVPPTE